MSVALALAPTCRHCLSLRLYTATPTPPAMDVARCYLLATPSTTNDNQTTPIDRRRQWCRGDSQGCPLVRQREGAEFGSEQRLDCALPAVTREFCSGGVGR